MPQEQLTKRMQKLIASLDQPKYRRREGLFKAEGTKCVIDTAPHFERVGLVATEKWLAEHAKVASSFPAIYCAAAADIHETSNLASRPEVIALYRLPDYEFNPSDAEGKLIIALDTVQDPGNLGTIVRIADWFGVRDIICSRETVDIFNPKAVMGTMGAIARVRVHYLDLVEALTSLSARMPVYGTFLDGENLFRSRLESNAVVVLGNEGNGISDRIGALVDRRITIPSYPPGEPTSESLNVATAAAITIAQFRNNG